MFSLPFSFKFFFNLSSNKLTFEYFFLHTFDHLHFKCMKLVIDNLLISHFPFIFIEEFLTNLIIILIHLHFFEFFPLFLNLSVNLLLSFFECQLHFPLLHGIAHHHFAMESFHLILSIMHMLISSLDSLKSSLHLQFILKSINFSSFNFLFL